MKRAIYGAMGVLIASLQSPAWAQVLTQDLALAESLFNHAAASKKAGNFKEACPKFAESNRLDPRPGTLMALADCEDLAGRIATAFALYADYLRSYQNMTPENKKAHAARAKKAEERQKAIQADIPELVILLPQGLPADAELLRNGTKLSLSIAGAALPIDPGEHVFLLRLAHGLSGEKRVYLEKGEHIRVELALPEPPAAAPQPGPSFQPAPLSTEIRPPPFLGPITPLALGDRPAPTPPPSLSLRTVGFVVGGVGVAGLAAGAILGGIAIRRRDSVDQHCADNLCDKEGLSIANTTQSLAHGSTAAFIAGGGLTLLGAALILYDRSSIEKPRRSVSLGLLGAHPAGTMFGAQGTF